MRIPAARERVGIEGHDGLFLVLWVDRETGTAEVIPVRGHDYRVLSVTFQQIRPGHQPGREASPRCC